MKPTFSEYIKYKFHNTLSRGTPALLSWLGIITIEFIALASIFVKVTVEGKKLSLINIIWISLTRVLDPGVIGGDTGSWPYLVVMLFITMVGVFIFSTLIGIVTTSINNSIQSLRKSKAPTQTTIK